LRAARDITDEEDAEIRAGALSDPDNPPLTAETIARMRPVAEARPELLALVRRARGPQKAPTKQLVSLRLDPDIIAHFRKRGAGWQRRINDTLRKAAGLKRV
jgi:uncharacterized protein (DUF4415 family)